MKDRRAPKGSATRRTASRRRLAVGVSLVAALAFAGAASAQYAYDTMPSTGDPTLDAILETINLLYGEELSYYVDEIVHDTGAPAVVVEEYIVERRYAPSDVWMIAELSQQSGRPFGEVASTFEQHREQGWGAVARQVGVKPGSPQFHALKNDANGFVTRVKSKPGRGHGRQRAEHVRVESARGGGPGKGHAKGNGHGKVKGHGNGNGKGKGHGKGKN